MRARNPLAFAFCKPKVALFIEPRACVKISSGRRAPGFLSQENLQEFLCPLASTVSFASIFTDARQLAEANAVRSALGLLLREQAISDPALLPSFLAREFSAANASSAAPESFAPRACPAWPAISRAIPHKDFLLKFVDIFVIFLRISSKFSRDHTAVRRYGFTVPFREVFRRSLNFFFRPSRRATISSYPNPGVPSVIPPVPRRFAARSFKKRPASVSPHRTPASDPQAPPPIVKPAKTADDEACLAAQHFILATSKFRPLAPAAVLSLRKKYSIRSAFPR